jgi:hypothetical protein
MGFNPSRSISTRPTPVPNRIGVLLSPFSASFLRALRLRVIFSSNQVPPLFARKRSRPTLERHLLQHHPSPVSHGPIRIQMSTTTASISRPRRSPDRPRRAPQTNSPITFNPPTGLGTSSAPRRTDLSVPPALSFHRFNHQNHCQKLQIGSKISPSWIRICCSARCPHAGISNGYRYLLVIKSLEWRPL